MKDIRLCSYHTRWIALILTSWLLGSCSGEPDSAAVTADVTPEASMSAVEEAAATLGMSDMNTLTFGGSAWRIRNSFRQTYTASPPWPEHDEITNYQHTLDLNSPVSRATGETFASNLFLEPPVAGTYAQNVAAGNTNWGQQLEYWLTPWGFLKGAEMYGAEESPQNLNGMSVTAVTWQSPASQTSPSGMRYTVTGYIDTDHHVRRVETRVEDAFMGDMLVANVYDDYQTIDGVYMPTTIEQQRGGGGVFGVMVTSAGVNPANAADLLAIPATPGLGGGGPGGAAPAAATEISQQLDEGVYVITGGYQSLVVEFADYVAVFEAGQSEARGEQVLAEVKRLFPDKQLRYLINSHPHSDHTAGIVPFVRAGATIVTHADNVNFLEMALSTPRTLLGEEAMEPRFRPVEGVTVLEDDTRRLELHYIENLHSLGTIVAVLPNEGILFQADFTLPVEGAETNPFVVNLAEYVDENDVQFERYIAVHAANEPQTREDLLAAIGR